VILLSNSITAENYSSSENSKCDVWDSFLLNNSLGNLWQTTDFGEANKIMYPRARTLRLLVTRDGVTEGLAQGIFSEYFGFGTVMDIREGPLLNMLSGNRRNLLKSIILAIEQHGIKNHIMRIKILWPTKWGDVDLIRNLGYEHVGTNFTYTINLDGGVEDLWRRIYGNKRRNIKKALDRGVEFVETSSFEAVEKFYSLVLDLAKRHDFVPTPLSYYQAIWKSRSQKDSSKIFFAKWKDNSISSVFATIHGKTIYALGFGYLGKDLEVRPNDFLHWKIMEWGCKRGFLRYHIGDVHPDKDTSDGGTWRWKKEWNGEIDNVYVFRKSISKYGLIERVYDELRRLRSLPPS
jgi:serine/alanine adding enzyme